MAELCLRLSLVLLLCRAGSTALLHLDYHPAWHLLEEECGESNPTDRIIGGTTASLGQFPWMARVGHLFLRTNKTEFLCGGALLNSRYVLTAAHCITEQVATRIYWIRLGENYLKQNVDCEGEICAPPAQDFGAEKIFVHENFNKTVRMKNDLALIRLDEVAKLNAFVQPICLPYGEVSRKIFTGSYLQVAGWGVFDTKYISPSEKLLFVRVPVVNRDVCRFFFPKQLIGGTQYCVGGEPGFDSCRGDSGGPLMKVDSESGIPKYYLVGVVSFGVVKCGSDRPAVYTRVGSYLHWILDRLES